jgi:hypothetical protein
MFILSAATPTSPWWAVVLVVVAVAVFLILDRLRNRYL